jgi:hypothetical protein
MHLLEWRSGRLSAQSIAVLFDRNRRFVRIVNHYQVRVPATAEAQPNAFAEGLRLGLELFAGAPLQVPRRPTNVWTPSHRTRTA